MCLLHGITYRAELLFLRLIYRILQIHTGNRNIGRDFYNIHAVNLPEFLLFCKGSTRHTALLLKFIK